MGRRAVRKDRQPSSRVGPVLLWKLFCLIFFFCFGGMCRVFLWFGVGGDDGGGAAFSPEFSTAGLLVFCVEDVAGFVLVSGFKSWITRRRKCPPSGGWCPTNVQRMRIVTTDERVLLFFAVQNMVENYDCIVHFRSQAYALTSISSHHSDLFNFVFVEWNIRLVPELCQSVPSTSSVRVFSSPPMCRGGNPKPGQITQHSLFLSWCLAPIAIIQSQPPL